MATNVPHGAQIERAMSAAMEAISTLPDDGDNVLLLNTIEGESDVLEVLDRVVEAAIADKKLAELARERAKRVEERARKSREIALRIIEALGVSPLERPIYTASLMQIRKSIVTNSDELPKEFIRESPDMIAINKALRAGEEVPGAELSNTEPSLRITTR